MTDSSLSQQCMQAVKMMLQPSLLSQWALRLSYIAALFAGLQAISDVSGTPSIFMWCNLSICLWLFNILCTQTQHNMLDANASKQNTNTSPLICALPVALMALFFALYACFVLLDWIPYVGTALSIVLTPLFFLLATMPPLAVLLQLALPIFVFPYVKGSKSTVLLLSAFQFLQQPARALGYFLLAYTPLALTLLLLWGSWETVFMMNRFSVIWWVSLLQKSLLLILSGICLAPATLFTTIMGTLPARGNASVKRSKTTSTHQRERAQWFMGGQDE